MKKIIKTTILLLVFALTLSGCGNAKISFPIGNGDKKEETVILTDIKIPIYEYDTLNPVISKDQGTYDTTKLFYNSLIEVDDKLIPIPSLAKNWQYENNNRELVLNLKSGVTFHDGSTFDANDVIYTIKTYMNKQYGTSTYSSFVANIRNVSKINNNTVKVYFYSSYDNAIENFTFPILPNNLFASTYEAYNLKEDYVPVGTGPYSVASIEKYKRINLQKNPTYWGENAFDNSITLEIIANTADQYNLLEIENINLMYSKGFDWEKYLGSKNVSTYEYPSNELEYIGFNFNNINLQDNKIRKAIAYAVDKENIIKVAYLGHVAETDNLFFPDYLGDNKYKDKYKMNIDLAKTYLKEAGYIDGNNDNLVENEKKQTLKFDILVNKNNVARVETAEILKNNLDKIGISTNIIYGDWEEYNYKIYIKDYDILIGGFSLSEKMDFRFALHSQYNNLISYGNLTLDDLLVELQRYKSIEEKKVIFKGIANIVEEELPYYPLFYKSKALIATDNLQGTITPQYNNIFKNITDWHYVKTVNKD